MKEGKIKITKDGPYCVSGEIPLLKMQVINDKEGLSESWKNLGKVKVKKEYSLCRCGNSKNKPFCDSSHIKTKFNGKETAGFEKYEENSQLLEGPKLILKDNPRLCASAGFCHRLSGTWNLVQNSTSSSLKKVAIQQACDCPSGRLVIIDKGTNKEIEPKLSKSIGLTRNEGELGPLWVRGKVPIESSNGKLYEARNRVTLCRCGKSGNKPFCDGSHRV